MSPVPADSIRVNGTVSIPLSELRFRFSRSSGPGGQNVNRRETQVELVFDVAGSPSLGPRQRARAMQRLARRLDAAGRLHVVASQSRTQGRNRELALERFRSVLADALRPPAPPRKRTNPSKGARERRLASKKRHSRLKAQRRFEPED